MAETWFTSDLHLGHDREFIWGPRGFKSVHEMNKEIISRYNSIVNMEDNVYILGDLMLGNNEVGISMIKQLKGNIHIIRGNHDTDSRMKLYNTCYNIVEITEGQFIKYNGYHFYLCHYPVLCSNYDEDKPLKAQMISLCGHTHTKDPFNDWDKGNIFHVEVDTNNCYPWNIDDIIEKIKINKRKVVL